MSDQQTPVSAEVIEAQIKVNQSAKNLSKSMEQVEHMIEDKTEIVTEAALGVQNVIDAPARLIQTIKDRAQPAVAHVKRNQKPYGIAAAVLVGLGLGAYLWRRQRR